MSGTFTISGTILSITRGFHVGILTSVEFGWLSSQHPIVEVEAWACSDFYTLSSNQALNGDTVALNIVTGVILLPCN